MDNDRIERRIERSLMRGCFKGKGLFARAADKVFFGILVALAAYLVSRSFHVRPNAAKFIAFASGAAFIMIHGIASSLRFRKYAEAKRKEVGERLMKIKLLLDGEESVAQRLEAFKAQHPDISLVLIRKVCAIDEDDVLSAMARHRAHEAHTGKKLVIAALSEPPTDVREFAEGLDERIGFASFLDIEQLSEQYRASDEEITGELLREAEKRSHKRPDHRRLDAVLSSAGKYRLLGAVLFASSFVMRFSIYIRTLSMLCFGAALIIGARDGMRRLKALKSA